jgi:hypothetical protein
MVTQRGHESISDGNAAGQPIKELAPFLVHSDRIYREWQIQDPESYLVILGGNRKEVEVTRLVVSSQELQRYLARISHQGVSPG